MAASVLKQSFQWAIVTRHGKLAVFSGQCPIFWSRKVAKEELASWVVKHDEFHIEKVTVLAVHR
jgi:hypothetical protein